MFSVQCSGREGRALRSLVLVIVLVLAVALDTSAAAATAVFTEDCTALTQSPHRLAGSDPAKAAAETIRSRLDAIGMDEILVQDFALVASRIKRCELVVTGRETPIPLQPMRPNGIIHPVTPPEGISGKLVDGGSARLEDFSGKILKDSIVVLDYNSSGRWLNAFALGAKAVIFVRDGTPRSWHPHTIDACGNLPRYFYAGSREDLLAAGSGVIHSEIVWERGRGQNVFGFLKGTDPKFGKPKSADKDDRNEELVVLSAHLDSYGEVPRLSPGARSAANCAALLRIAERIKENRPRRHVLIAFFDAQCRGHLGASAFYRALEDDDSNKNARIKERGTSLSEEQKFLSQLEELLAKEDPLRHPGTPARRKLRERVRDKAREEVSIVREAMRRLREERYDIEKAARDAGRNKTPEEVTRVEEIQTLLDEQWQPLRDDWNKLQRALGKDSYIRIKDLPPAVEEKLQITLKHVRHDLSERLSQLEAEEKALRVDTRINDLIGDKWIALHASLLLGDATPRWGLVIGGDSGFHSANDSPGLYGKIQTAFLRAYQDMEEAGTAPAGFLVRSVDQTLTRTRTLLGIPFLAHSGEVAGQFGIYNLALGTCQESLAREGTPADLLERLDLDRIEKQTDEIMSLLPSLISRDGLSLRRGIVSAKEYIAPTFRGDQPTGAMVMGMLKGSAVPNTPMPDAVVQFRPSRPLALSYERRKAYAFDNYQVLLTDRNGLYRAGPLSMHSPTLWDKTYGTFAAVFDERGLPLSASDDTSFLKMKERINVYTCKSGILILPPQVRMEKVSALDKPIMLSARATARLEPNQSFYANEMKDRTLSWYVEDKERGIKTFSLRNIAGLNNGTELLEANEALKKRDKWEQGAGFDATGHHLPRAMTLRSASDLWRLNEARLDILRSKNIMDNSLEELHGRAEDMLIAAREDDDPVRQYVLAASAFWASRPVYTKVRAMLDDLVQAVLILLALSVPFAFALERVVIGSTTVYRQLWWFFIIFAVTFVVLYFAHPAFAIANTPVIIFLAFAILVMSCTVIYIIMRKFEVELKAIQGLTSTLHAADVSRVSTFVAAMHMGISTMRRRPLRTALTAITIILLTFTILCFASFGKQSGIVKFFIMPKPAYSGVYVHDVNWKPLPDELTDVLRYRWPEQTKRVFTRFWRSPKAAQEPGILVSRHDGSRPLALRGVLGLQPAELDERADLRKIFPGLDRDSVLLSGAVARAIGVAPGDPILLAGRRLTVGPLLDAIRVSAARDMDNSNILPVDFTEASSQQGQDAVAAEDSATSDRTWACLSADAVAVVTAATAYEMDAKAYGVTLYTDDASAAEVLGEDLARMLPLPIAATRSNGVYRHVLGTVLAASGGRDLFFPILLGGLVIFGTMLGSVSDREKEIYTFSALGLAPRHVATLFFAEAVVYSLIGGMAGYLLAQGSMKVLTVMADYGLVRVPEMNMSSTNTIVTILIVMATVLASAIYPAIKASKSANPGLMRSWRPPEPEGDVMDMIFPFTVSEYDITGVVSFLKEHFENYSDTGLGRFMARNSRLVKDEKGMLGLDSDLALAPFDLGVSQSFALRSRPSEIEGIDEVHIRLERQSGQPKDWMRLNKVFLDDMRRQFLIWRSIPRETMELYRDKTLVELGKKSG